MRVKKLAEEICVELFIQEVVDEAMGIDGDVNAVDANGGMREIIQLSGCDGHWRENFLFNERRCWMDG